MVNNPGTPVSLRAENNLKNGAYWIRMKEKTSRVVTPVDVTLEATQTIMDRRSDNDVYVAPTGYPTINDKDWLRTMELIHEFLDSYLGKTQIPLGYVIRDDVTPPADPDPAGGYQTIEDEMMRRAPHGCATFLTDNKKVWSIISKITRDENCYSYVKPAQRTQDGRAAYLMLYNHYLGPNNVNNMASTAEHNLSTVRYAGETKRYNFEKYVRHQIDQHTVLEGLIQHGHCGIDAGSKVRYLLNGIHTTALDSVKTQVLSTPGLLTDFDRCVNLFQDFLKQSSALNTSNINISKVVTDKSESIDSSNQEEPEDRYYRKYKYKSLDSHGKSVLYEKRQRRRQADSENDHGGGGGGGGRNNRNNRGQNKKLKTANASLKRKIKALKSQIIIDKEDDDTSSNKEPSNRTNNALTRQTAGPKKKKVGC